MLRGCYAGISAPKAALLRSRALQIAPDQHDGCLSVARFVVPGAIEKRRVPRRGKLWAAFSFGSFSLVNEENELERQFETINT